MSDQTIDILKVSNRILTYLGYVSLAVLLVWEGILDANKFWLTIFVCGAGFLIVTVLRILYNSPRPYEKDGVEPLIDKTTVGKSFPSRHTFCMFMIAMSWIPWCWPIGALLLLCGCYMAFCRVLLRVHYPQDVIVGALLAIIFGVIGYHLYPW